MINRKKMITVMVIGILLVGLLPISSAQADLTPGKLDTGFDPGSGVTGWVNALTIQPDGMVLMGGFFTKVNGVLRNNIARLNADGSLDNSFDPGSGPNSNVYTLMLQPDGKVLIGGSFWEVDGVARIGIARLKADGSLDNSFNPDIGTYGSVNTIVIQSDGKVLLGGYFGKVDGVERKYIARLNTDGSLDSSFDPGSGANSEVRSLAVQPDGKVLIGGNFTTVDSVVRHGIARLNADGTMDSSFDPGSGANGDVISLAIQPDGKVLIGGGFTMVAGVASNHITRLNADGTLDRSFDPGSGLNEYVRKVTLQPDGKVMISGDFTTVNGEARNRITRLNADGSVDSSFNPGNGANYDVRSFAIYPDGKVVIGGNFTTVDSVVRYGIARLNADGTLDVGLKGLSFNSGTANIGDMVPQPDGKIIIAGEFSEVNGVGRNNIARLNADGSLDNNFDPGTGTDGVVWAVALQPDGKVLIGGSFTTVDGQPRPGIARLQADGSLDGTFNTNLWRDPGDPSVVEITLMDGGQILIGGLFSEVNGGEQAHLAKLNPDGSVDSSFTPDFNSLVGRIVVQPDEKILVSSAGSLIRLNPDGSRDTDFQRQGDSTQKIHYMDVLPDGKIVVGGTFDTLEGINRNHIARLNPDGSLDADFDPGAGPDALVFDVLAQPDGKVLIAGNFTQVAGESRVGVARLNSDGTLDEDFVSQASHTYVAALALQPDGKALAGGVFTISDSGNTYKNLVRLNGATPPEITSVAPVSTATVGDTSDHTFTASGFPQPTYYLSEGSLPPGLILDAVSGALSGTFTGAGNYLFEITASNSNAPSDTQSVIFTVNKGDTTTEITTVSPEPSTVGESVVVSYAVTAPGGAASGEVTVSDGVRSCSGTVVEGSCELQFSEAGKVTLTAVYAGDDNYNPSLSDGVQHIVEQVEIPVTGGELIYLPVVVYGD